MSVHGMTVAVVGANGAIGRAICASLRGDGAEVVAFDLLGGSLPDGLEVHPCDAADPDQVADAFAEHAEPADLDALVNVAGWFEIVDFTESTPKQWQAALDANLLTAMSTCRAVLPAWVRRGSGSVVNFASTAGEYGSIRPAAAYAAAKGAVIAFSKSLAREVSPSGVRVNVVSPGPVETEMLQAGAEDAHQEAVARTLLGRLGRPDDVAAAVAYLVGSGSAWVTGEVLRVNGGSLL